MEKELFMKHIQISKILEKLWKCQQCNEVFMSKSHFNVHSLLVHKRIEPYKDEIIQKQFNKTYDAAEHKRSQKGKQLFVVR